jgi:diaminohydroxyphosphoribosylaminopyrimidine deaminase/5-amino-6-(5-phosphoribosylamino)uracil reductase
MSLDGRTAMASGESQWITGAEARRDVHQWRARSCAVLTGIGTVLHDDPALTARPDNYHRLQPLRVIADSEGRLPTAAQTLRLPGKVVLACGAEAATYLQQGQVCGSGLQAELTIMPVALLNGRLNLKALLQQLASDWQCNEVWVEAGATLTGALLQAGLVDELFTYIAPALLGEKARPLAALPGLERLADKLSLRFTDVAMVGEDCRIRSRVLPRA